MADPAAAPLPPAWFTPRRLLAIFCAVNILIYLDRGLFASNGVNGSPRTAEAPAGSGIQVRASFERDAVAADRRRMRKQTIARPPPRARVPRDRHQR